MLVSLAAGLTACGWSETQRVTFSFAHSSDSSLGRTALMAHYLEQQNPTGLRAFPDGGKPRQLARGVVVYLCDAGEQSLRRLGVASEPESDFNIAPAAGAWDSTGFVVGVGRSSSPIPYGLTRFDYDGGQRAAGVSFQRPAGDNRISEYCSRMRDSLTTVRPA